nr:DUF4233 domain-containing protein [Janibacter hoylei]
MLSGVFVTMMFAVGVIFALLYFSCVRIGRRVDHEQAERAVTEQES